MQDVKLRLEKALKSRKKSMYALAKETEIAYSTVFKLAKKDVKNVDVENLKKICKNLNCSPVEILGFDFSIKNQ